MVEAVWEAVNVAAFSFIEVFSMTIHNPKKGWRKSNAFRGTHEAPALRNKGLPAVEASPCRPLAAHHSGPFSSVKTLRLGLDRAVPAQAFVRARFIVQWDLQEPCLPEGLHHRVCMLCMAARSSGRH